MSARFWLISSLVGWFFPFSARADESALRAQLRCERGLGPGRIVCELTTRAQPGRLVWSDALLVQAPLFARPLRSRVALPLGTSEAGVASAKFALVASEPGRGMLELLVRAVVCRALASGQSCSPKRLPVSTWLEVDSPSSPRSAPAP
jgi:hypothetical protein